MKPGSVQGVAIVILKALGTGKRGSVDEERESYRPRYLVSVLLVGLSAMMVKARLVKPVDGTGRAEALGITERVSLVVGDEAATDDGERVGSPRDRSKLSPKT